MSTIKYLRVFGLTLILLVTLVGQSQAQGQQPASQPLALKAAYPAYFPQNFVSANYGVDPVTLDPALAYDTTSGELIQNIYETLVFYDGANTNAFVPQLASSYELSPDGLTWTFHIRTGVTFQDGASLTPADVAYSFQRGLLQGGMTYSPQWLLSEPFFGVGIQDISLLVDPTGGLIDNRAALQAWNPAELVAACQKVKDAIVADSIAGTVTMHLAQPWGPFLGTIAGTWGSILEKNWTIAHAGWDDSCATWQNWYGMQPGEDSLTAITNGTGPFKLDHWTPGVEVVLSRNNSYWRTPAQLEHVSFLNIPDENTRFNMLMTGSADQASLSYVTRPLADNMVGENCPWNVTTAQYDCSVVDPAKPLRLYKGRPGINQDEVIFNFNISVPAGGNPYIGSGLLDGNGVPPDFFSDVHIRKAFNYCFDWNTFNSEVYGGSIVQPTSLLLEGMPGYDLNAAHYSLNLTQCTAEFQASTLIGTGGQSLWDTGFHVQMLYNEGNGTRQRVAELLASAIHAINPKFVLDVVSLPWTDYLSQQRAGTIPIMTAGWFEDIHDPHNWYQPYLLGTYAGRYHIPDDLKAQFAVLINQGVLATTFVARDTIYKQLNQLIYDNAMFILLGGATNHGFIQRRVHGIIQNQIYQGKYYYTIYKDPTNLVFLPLVVRNYPSLPSVGGTVFNMVTQSPMPGVTVRLYFGTFGGSPNYSATSDVNGSFIFPNIPPGTYSIVALPPSGYIGNGNMVVVGNVNINITLTLIKDIALLSPPNNAVVASNPDLCWEAMPQAVSYRLQVNRKSDWLLIANPQVTNSCYHVSATLENNVTYSWSLVNALNAQGQVIGGSGDYSFTYNPSAAVSPP